MTNDSCELILLTNDGTRRCVAPRGTTLADALRRENLLSTFECGGRGVCGKCRVVLRDNLASNSPRRSALACQPQLDSASLVVDLRSNSSRNVAPLAAPCEDALRSEIAASPSAQERRGSLALAVDLGTTTLACALVSLASGRVLGVRAMRNPQIPFGRDVLSRIAALDRDSNVSATLRNSVTTAVGKCAWELANELELEPSRLRSFVFSGNTTMEYFLTGLDARPLGRAPFEVAVSSFPVYRASEFNWGALLPYPEATVRLFPVCSAFIGGDVVAGLTRLSRCGAFADDAARLFFDVGTNGEAALSYRGALYATSTAVGPAFEGAELSCGSLATRGAICAIDYNVSSATWRARTIDDAPPCGLCGSGLVDALACALDFGLIQPNGRIVGNAERLPLAIRNRLCVDGRDRAIILSDPDRRRRDAVGSNGSGDDLRDVVLTQRDARQAQLALGAVKTGVKLLLAQAESKPEQLDAMYLAGGFGAAVDRANAKRVGLIPKQLECDRVQDCGNASLLGAIDAIRDESFWGEAENVAKRVQTFDLACKSEFADTFAAEMSF